MAEPAPETWEAFGLITPDRDGVIDLCRIAGNGADHYRWWILPGGRIILDPLVDGRAEELPEGNGGGTR